MVQLVRSLLCSWLALVGFMASQGEARMARRSLQTEDGVTVGSLQQQALGIIDQGVMMGLSEEQRKKYDDDYYNSKSGSGSKDYDDDDDYHKPKGECSEFFEATKKFFYDVYCVVRQLDCTEYHPGGKPYDDDDDHYDDDSRSKSKDKHARRNTRQRSLQGTTTINMDQVTGAKKDDDYYYDDDDDSYSKSKSKSSSKDHHDDDLYDDDFFDDDYHVDNSGANFWQLLDASCQYVQSLWSIFGGDKKDHDKSGSYEDDKYYDDYYKSKDKHVRTRNLRSR